MPTPVTHSKFFPISSGHHSLDCDTCHGQFDTFQKFSCASGTCHPQATIEVSHAGRSGYQYDSDHCYLCHPHGTAVDQSVNHAKFFPIAAGQRHANIPCAQCHQSADQAMVTCTDSNCHPQTATVISHADVGGFQWSSALCLRCHAEGLVYRPTTHSPFLIVRGRTHYRESCLVCHPQSRTDKPVATDFMQFSCAACHRPDQSSHFNQPATTCVGARCHIDGSRS